MEERIIELESRYTVQQSLLEDLSAVLIAQQKAMDALRAEVAWLKKKLDAEPGMVDASRDDPPPHF